MSRLFEEVKDIIKFELYGAARDSDGCEISYRFGDCNQRKLDVLKHEVIEWLLSEGFAEDEIDVNCGIVVGSIGIIKLIIVWNVISTEDSDYLYNELINIRGKKNIYFFNKYIKDKLIEKLNWLDGAVKDNSIDCGMTEFAVKIPKDIDVEKYIYKIIPKNLRDYVTCDVVPIHSYEEYHFMFNADKEYHKECTNLRFIKREIRTKFLRVRDKLSGHCYVKLSNINADIKHKIYSWLMCSGLYDIDFTTIDDNGKLKISASWHEPEDVLNIDTSDCKSLVGHFKLNYRY